MNQSHSNDRDNPGKIFIGGLPEETGHDEINNHFGKYGDITDTVIMKDCMTGQPRGFGFISYADPLVVDKVIEDNHVLSGKQVEIKRTIPRETSNSKDFKTKKIFVGGIPISLAEDELATFFLKYGKAVDHEIVHDQGTNRSRGFGSVLFYREEVVDELLSNGNLIDTAGNQIMMEDSSVDLFTRLPDEIHHTILSFITSPKERAICSVLSKTLHSITRSYPYLHFSLADFLRCIPGSSEFCPDQEARDKFFSYVDSNVVRFCDTGLRAYSFSLSVDHLTQAEEDAILRCLHLLAIKGFAELSIQLSRPFMRLLLPSDILSGSSLKSLDLQSCILSSFTLAYCKSLKILTLQDVSITDHLIIKELEVNFPVLEELSILSCCGIKRFFLCGPESLWYICLEHNSEVESIEINANSVSTLSLHLLDTLAGDEFEGTSINVGGCRRLKSLTIYGYSNKTLQKFESDLRSFQFLETLYLVPRNQVKDLRLCSPSLRVLIMNEFCDLDETHLQLGSHDFSFALATIESLPHTKSSVYCDMWDNKVDTCWFEKLGRFLKNTKRFKLLILDINQQQIYEKNQTTFSETAWEIDSVELISHSLNVYELYISLLDDLLCCCCPRTLTLSANFCANNFDNLDIVKYTCGRLLCGYDKLRPNLEIEVSFYDHNTTLRFPDLSSLIEADPSLVAMTSIKFKKLMKGHHERQTREVGVNLPLSREPISKTFSVKPMVSPFAHNRVQKEEAVLFGVSKGIGLDETEKDGQDEDTRERKNHWFYALYFSIFVFLWYMLS